MSHPVSRFCGGQVCGPCLRAGVRVPATHKIGEEIAADDSNPIRHGLTQFVCCRCFCLMMGQAATWSCGVGMPGLPRLVPVYGILGEKLVESGAVSTEPIGSFDNIPARRPTELPVPRVSRAELELQKSLVRLSSHVGMPVSVTYVSLADGEEAQ